MSSPRWLNTRFVVGVVVVVAPIVIGAHVLASADSYAEVYLARSPLVVGEQVSAADLAIGRVRFDGQAPRYIAVGRAPVGYVVTRAVGAGELLPLSAVRAGTMASEVTRLVTVPVGTGHVPAGLTRGELVDVYVTPKLQAPTADRTPVPHLVLDAAPVDSVTGSGALSSSGTISVVLEVPVARVSGAIGAIESGTIDVVRVPSP